MLLIPLILGCGTDDTAAPDTSECDEAQSHSIEDACDAFTATPSCPIQAGDSWVSLEERECGLSSTACPSVCFWSLEISDGTWRWDGSDFGLEGTWGCDAGTLVMLDYAGTPMSWDFSDETCVMTWAEVDYRLEP